jgi:hypothetical protein
MLGKRDGSYVTRRTTMRHARTATTTCAAAFFEWWPGVVKGRYGIWMRAIGALPGVTMIAVALLHRGE